MIQKLMIKKLQQELVSFLRNNNVVKKAMSFNDKF